MSDQAQILNMDQHMFFCGLLYEEFETHEVLQHLFHKSFMAHILWDFLKAFHACGYLKISAFYLYTLVIYFYFMENFCFQSIKYFSGMTKMALERLDIMLKWKSPLLQNMKFHFFQNIPFFKNRKFYLWRLVKRFFQIFFSFFDINFGFDYCQILKFMAQSLPHIRKSAINLSHDDLTAMKIRANLIDVANIKESKDLELYQISRERTSKWSDNYRDLKRRKQEERYRKFQREQLEKRKTDLQEKKFKKKWREEQIAKANAKLFQDREQIRALNSQLLYSETLKQREGQIQFKKQLKETEKQKQFVSHQELLMQIHQKQLSEKATKQQKIKRMKQYQKQLKKQNREVKKCCIQKIKDQIQEGQLLKEKAKREISEAQQAERLRRLRAIKNNRQIKEINEKNKKLRQKQIQKEKEEELKIQQFRKNKEIIEDLNKKQEKQLIDVKIRERQHLYHARVQHLATIQNTENQRFQKQIQEIEKKKKELQQKKTQEKERLRKDFEDSLKDQVEKNKQQKVRMRQENEIFKQQQNKKLASLREKENDYSNFLRLKVKQNQKLIKNQIEDKKRKRQNKYRRQLEQYERVEATHEQEKQDFRSYAQKCCKEWGQNGKSLYPMIKLLSEKMKN